MQIGFNSLPTLPVPAAYRRDELAERRQQQSEPTAAAPSQAQKQGPGEVTRIRTRASVAAQRVDDQLPRNSAGLSAYVRNAVTAYSNNGPSIEERLGVELVGVDTYA